MECSHNLLGRRDGANLRVCVCVCVCRCLVLLCAPHAIVTRHAARRTQVAQSHLIKTTFHLSHTHTFFTPSGAMVAAATSAAIRPPPAAAAWWSSLGSSSSLSPRWRSACAVPRCLVKLLLPEGDAGAVRARVVAPLLVHSPTVLPHGARLAEALVAVRALVVAPLLVHRRAVVPHVAHLAEALVAARALVVTPFFVHRAHVISAVARSAEALVVHSGGPRPLRSRHPVETHVAFPTANLLKIKCAV